MFPHLWRVSMSYQDNPKDPSNPNDPKNPNQPKDPSNQKNR